MKTIAQSITPERRAEVEAWIEKFYGMPIYSSGKLKTVETGQVKTTVIY